ncbi:MAG: hypothetical protein F6K47_33075 [Symploca sp. SIO2E6]|nr:hypothetical protein [Symploca sp. SIO2E6]
MSEQSNQFSHLPLRLTNQGTAASLGGGSKPSATTLANRGNADGHVISIPATLG